MTQHFKNGIEKLKGAVDIISVANHLGILPEKKGSVFQGGRCPTGHDSKGQECFTIFPSTQSAYCFNCAKSWDVIGLVQEVHRSHFMEACNWLSEKFNVPCIQNKEMTSEEMAEHKAKVEKQKLIYDILTVAARFYHVELCNDAEMQPHLTTHYSLNEDTLSTYSLGYSTGDGLQKHLLGIGYSDDQIVQTGLFLKLNGKLIEFYRHRFIFPYWKSGVVVYLIGRKTDRTPDETWEQGKYKKLLTRNEKRPYISELVSNSHFYCEDSIRGADTIYVAEGVTDCLAMLQAGYPTISPVTTRFRNQDLPRLQELTKCAQTIYLTPDAEKNEAGIKGAIDTAAALEGLGKAAYIVQLRRPEGVEKIDATDFLRDNGKETFDKLIDQAKTPLQLEIDDIASKDLDLIRLSEALSPIKEKMARMSQDKVSAYLGYLKDTLQVKTDFIQGLNKEISIIIKRNSKDLKSQDDLAGAAKYSAIFAGLVEIVVDENDNPAFLTQNHGSLEVTNKIDNDGEQYDPPPAKSMKWLLARADEVLKYYHSDTDDALYYDVVTYLKNISELPSENHYHLLAIWVFHTYLFEKAEYSPYIWLYAIPERGKSRTGKGCMYIARRGLHVESLRDAYLIRVAENLGVSLFIDVIDLWKKAVRTGTEDILLLRYEKGATVPRVLYPDKGPHRDTVYFDIYGPTIVATNHMVSEIFATRAIQIVMPESDRQFENDVKPEDGLELKERLTAFRARHMDKALPHATKPSKGRLGDILRPLRQIVKLVVPDEEGRFLKLCNRLASERYENLADTLEAQILQTILDLDLEIEHGFLEAAKIGDKINENQSERFKKSQAAITRICKSMGFRAKRPKGKTHIDIDKKLLQGLSARYLGKNAEKKDGHTSEKTAQSAPTAKSQDNREDSGGTFGADNAWAEEKCTQSARKVHPVTNRNDMGSAAGAESAENTGVPPLKKMGLFEAPDEVVI